MSRIVIVGFVLVLVALIGASSAKPQNRIGVHSMLYSNTLFGGKKAFFKESAASGASSIRFDIALSGVFADPKKPDWTGVNEFMQLCRKYKLKALAVLLATPWWLTKCRPGIPFEQSYICPPSDPKKWAALAGRVAKHTRGVINDFEIINEADGAWAFSGTPQEYARVLAASYKAIHKANPKARVSFTGLMRGSTSWSKAVFATKGVKVAKSFDIINVHIRGRTSRLAPAVKKWLKFFRQKCKKCPLWVTETGYAADKTYQTQVGLKTGEQSQAKWTKIAVPSMLKAGAQKVFLTLRDYGSGNSFASEGFLASTDPITSAPVFRRRPSFFTIQKLSKKFLLKKR
jgi:hypothetical protein